MNLFVDHWPDLSEPGAATPLISLIVSTLGRAEEIPRLLDSLARQSESRFEVILVDQNDDAELVGSALRAERAFPMLHLRSPGVRGASRGRNIGLAAARGSIVGFPDDDCWYPPDYLARMTRLLEAHGVDFVAGRATDETGRTINGRFEAEAMAIDRRTVWTTLIEWIQGARVEALRSIDGYDETIGIGAATPWQACEAQDLGLRLIEAGYKGWYDPEFVGHHAELDVTSPDERMISKMRGYGRGMGYVLRRHRYGGLEKARWLVRSLAGATLAATRGNMASARLQLGVFQGRLEGMRGSISSQRE